jgi:uncharacterized membrane protein YkoI
MSKLTALWLALTVSSVSAPVLAQPVSQPAHPLGNVSAFRGKPSTLTNIIQQVEQTGPGRVIEIRFDDSLGTPAYYLAVAESGKVSFLHLAREGGEIVPVDEHSQPVGMMSWRKRDNARLAAHAPVSLSDAIRTAEQHANGAPAVAAGIARGASSPTTDVHAYNVLVLRPDGATHRVAVDSETGEVIADPSALGQWP